MKDRAKELEEKAKEIEELRKQYEKASVELFACCTKEDLHERLKNKNQAWFAYKDAVGKSAAIKEQYAMCAKGQFGWGLIDEVTGTDTDGGND